jgi:serine/threonine protein kinase
LRSIESEQSVRIKAIRKRLVKEESKIMMRFNNPNLLKCYECFENRDLKLMVIEYCENGSLQEKIETVKKIP